MSENKEVFDYKKLYSKKIASDLLIYNDGLINGRNESKHKETCKKNRLKRKRKNKRRK